LTFLDTGSQPELYTSGCLRGWDLALGFPRRSLVQVGAGACTAHPSLPRSGDIPFNSDCDYFLCNVAMGLHYIHAAGVAHGDICPANVWLLLG